MKPRPAKRLFFLAALVAAKRLFILAALAAAIGCESDDARVARVAEEASARQADQNRQMARLVASQQAVEQRLDAQRGHLDQQRTDLENERRSIAAERIRDPIIANALIGAMILAACALPLLLAFRALRSAHGSDSDNAALTELLVHELVADEPLLLPHPALPALDQQTSPE